MDWRKTGEMAKKGRCWMSGSCEAWLVTTTRTVSYSSCTAAARDAHDGECCGSEERYLNEKHYLGERTEH